MPIANLQKKLIAVLGYGLEGQTVTNYLIKHGIKPVLFDQRPWEEWPKEEQEDIKKLEVNFIFGPDCFKELTGFDIVFRSPGIPFLRTQNELSKNTEITSQTKYFFENCPAKIIGVTGTKGKGTTSALIYEMLAEQVKSKKLKVKSYLTGNIGKVQPLDFLDNLTKDDWIVYELSSFQLQDLTKSPHIAVVLMTTKEHLDYHINEQEYLEAKTSITKFQNSGDCSIINADFKNSIEIGKKGQAKKLYFSRQKQADCCIQDDFIISGDDFRFPISDLLLKGQHNLENACASVLSAQLAGCSQDCIKKTLKTFKGLEHRLELVAEKQGIKFYNDSFSTTPETAIAAINSFSEPEVLILGGSTKNSDFTELINTIANSNNIKSLILIGEEGERIKKALTDVGGYKGTIQEGAKNMAEIFQQIKDNAKTGDVVLLSPACASFGMFKNYKDRGEQFKKHVELWQ